ncbi:MAG: nucleotide exchange factor GrpE, partial [Verrucomicrobiales bacterium]
VQVIAKDLIRRIDALDDLIDRFQRFDSDKHLADQLVVYRQGLLELLAGHGVSAFRFAAGEKIDLDTRDRVQVVEAKSDRVRDVAKVVETVRPGYLHVSTAGETVLRPAEVIASNP